MLNRDSKTEQSGCKCFCLQPEREEAVGSLHSEPKQCCINMVLDTGSCLNVKLSENWNNCENARQS